jgi:hypothetical protein
MTLPESICPTSPTGGHHWLIPASDSEKERVVEARCKHCGATKKLAKWLDLDAEKRRVPPIGSQWP